MRASKENARKMIGALNESRPTKSQEQLFKKLMRFLEACEQQLPENSYYQWMENVAATRKELAQERKYERRHAELAAKMSPHDGDIAQLG